MIKKIAAATVLLLTVAAFGLPARAQTTQDVLDKMIEAIGGRRALEEIKDSTISGTLEMGQMGMSGTFTMYHKGRDKMRIDIEIMGTTITQAFDGTRAWFTDPRTGSATEMPEAQAQSMKRQALGNDAILNPAKYGMTYTLKPGETVDGVSCLVLENRTADGHLTTIYVDPKTYLTCKQRSREIGSTGEEADIESYPSDYRKVDGLTMAYALKNSQGGTEIMHMVFTRVSFNKGLEDALFEMK